MDILDRGDAGPNDPEPLRLNGVNHDGRSPLYWACFGGHATLVRELLARGGVDDDGTCFIAVSSRAKADDDRDLFFDPDREIYSDYVDYEPREIAVADADVASEIRDLLAAAERRRGVFYSTKECVVCATAKAVAKAEPCGHVACCAACLETLRDRRMGCPLCRERIRAIVVVDPGPVA